MPENTPTQLEVEMRELLAIVLSCIDEDLDLLMPVSAKVVNRILNALDEFDYLYGSKN